MKEKTRPACRKCAFLGKWHISTQNLISWDDNDRDQGFAKAPWYSKCTEGVWDEDADPHMSMEWDKVLDQDRSQCLFFMEYDKQMPLDGARKLREERKSIRKSRREKLTLGMIVIASTVACVNLVVNVLQQLQIL